MEREKVRNGSLVRSDRNLHVRLLLLKSVSSVVKLVVGAAISVRKVSSLVPSHLFSSTLQSYETVLNLPSNFIIPSVSPGGRSEGADSGGGN